MKGKGKFRGDGPSRGHFILFALLSVFAVAQVSWWVVFQVQIGRRLTQMQTDVWHQQLNIAARWAEVHHDNLDAYRAWLAHTFPDLELTPDDRELIIGKPAEERLDRTTAKFERMFIWEGGFFSLLLIGGVIFMYWMMRREVNVERRQASFLSAITHELKTPLTAIRLYLETILERDLPPEQQNELLGSMTQNLDRLQGLIDRLLQARGVLSRAARTQAQVVNLTEETREAVQHSRKQLEQLHTVEIRSDLEPEMYARIDPEQWRILVGNLVENAVKYSPEGGDVVITLAHRGRRVRLEVSDHGVGFERSERKRIFQRFYRVGSEDTRSTQGSGLGLYLVREIAQTFGGRAFADSPGPGRGATITITLPFVEEPRRGGKNSDR